MNEQPYLRVSEFAQRMGVTRQTVHRWITEGRLKCVPSLNSWLIDANEVHNFVPPSEQTIIDRKQAAQL